MAEWQLPNILQIVQEVNPNIKTHGDLEHHYSALILNNARACKETSYILKYMRDNNLINFG